MRRIPTLAAALVALACFAVSPAIAQNETHEHEHADGHGHAHGEHAALPTLGVAVVVPTKGNKTRGSLRLVQKGADVHVSGKIRNLTEGLHGFHIHEFGDLRDMAEGKSAGGHFNPSGTDHGTPGHGHAGDLGNITAGADGVATVDVTLKKSQLHFFLGRCFVVHADADDLKSQPSGNAGPRVGLGIIGIGNPDFKYAGKKADK